MEGKLKNSQKFPQEWDAFQRCGSSKFISIEEEFDPHLAEVGRYSQLLKNRNKGIIIDPESSGFTSNQRVSRNTYNSQKTNIQTTNNIVVKESLVRPRKDQLLETIGSIYSFKLNELTKQIELDNKQLPGDYFNTFYLELAEKNKLDVNSQKASDAAKLIARRNSFHPVKDYLDSCNQPLEINIWDNLASYCFGVNENLSTIHIQRQLIAAVARIYKVPCKVDTALVLQSDKQGMGKGKFWEAIGGDWYSASLGDLRNVKEDKITLHNAWIHEWGEIDRVMGMQSSEQLKSFMSEQWDIIRYPFDKSPTRVNRKCVLVGTTNKRDFIKDPTGNRRFPIISPKYINYDWVLRNRDNILSSAKYAFNNGDRYWYETDEIKVINAIALNYAPEDPLKDNIENFLEGYIKTYKRDSICIYQYLLSTSEDLERDRKDTKLTRQISTRLQSLGWQKQQDRKRFKLTTEELTEKTTIYKMTAT